MPEPYPAWQIITFEFAAKGNRGALKALWYDGGKMPPKPEHLGNEMDLADNGIYFVGDKGTILGGFRSENPQLIPDERMRAYRVASNIPEPVPPPPRQRTEQDNRPRVSPRDGAWIEAFKGGPRSYGDFLLAGPICDAVNLAAISLRLGGRRLLWDAAAARITNAPDANAFLTRECRPGWQL